MKILWLYKFIPEYDFDNWLHMRFAEVVAQDQEITLNAYGPGLEYTSPHLIQVKFGQNVSIQELDEFYSPDFIILNTKSRMFYDYNPHNGQSYDHECWLPKGFAQYKKAVKVVLEEDYHYEKNDMWYQQMGIDLILQRHYMSSLRKEVVPMKWLPFSVDTKVFYDRGRNRIEKVCLAGSSGGAYPERELASHLLSAHGLIDIFKGKQKIGPHYVECLQEYVCHLSGSSRYHITPAKMFEIMASGSVLLTNIEHDLDFLFPSGSYATYRADSYYAEKDLIKTARTIVSDAEYRKFVVEKAKQVINERHTHQQRIQELKVILKGIKG